jgi:hypothetical protein
VKYYSPLVVDRDKDLFPQVYYPETLKTSKSLASLRRDIKTNIAKHKALNARTELSI